MGNNKKNSKKNNKKNSKKNNKKSSKKNNKKNRDSYVEAGSNVFCADNIFWRAMTNVRKDECRTKCTADSRCKYYSLWSTGWCLMSETCDKKQRDGRSSITIYQKEAGRASILAASLVDVAITSP